MKSVSLDSPDVGRVMGQLCFVGVHDGHNNNGVGGVGFANARRGPGAGGGANLDRRRCSGGGAFSAFGAANRSGPSSHNQQSPSSPVHNRRVLSSSSNRTLQPVLPNPPPSTSTMGAAGRMSSLDAGDDVVDKSISTGASPSVSPKSHRFAAPNLYVVLYNYKPRQHDELELKAGFKLSVIDKSDKDWWQGKCFGSVGYFPSSYVVKLQPGERPLQVLQAVQVPNASALDPPVKLLRDQIVIQQSDDLVDGSVLVKTAESIQALCPPSLLQEV